MITQMALFAAVILPLWNIPLIMRMIKRKSSNDVSLYWAFGVWICLLIMLPQGLKSSDIVWKTFSIVNIILFSVVVFTVALYHKPRGK